MEIVYLAGLEAKSPRASCPQSHLPLRRPRRALFQASLRGFGGYLACGSITPAFTWYSLRGPLSAVFLMLTVKPHPPPLSLCLMCFINPWLVWLLTEVQLGVRRHLQCQDLNIASYESGERFVFACSALRKLQVF